MSRPEHGEVLRCEVIRWRTEPTESTGWHVVEVRELDGAELVVTGCNLPRPGSQLEARGEWQEYRGQPQFFVRHIVSARPSLNPDGVMRWLRDRCEGIGPMRAAALLAHFGGNAAALWSALEQGPVLGIKGIDAEMAQHIHETFLTEGSQAEHYAVLRGWGLTQAQISRCLQHWVTAGEAVQVLHKDPYQLAEHVGGFGFKRADAVALKIGVARDSSERVCAGIVWQLDELQSLGHVYGDESFFHVVARALGVQFKQVTAGIRMLRDRGKLAVHDGREVYLPELLIDEGSAAGMFLEAWWKDKEVHNAA